MGPVILAIGRSENHPILKAAASALGIRYLEIETGLLEVNSKEVLQSLSLQRSERNLHRPAILAVIDSSVGRSELESFLGQSQEVFSLPRIWQKEEPREISSEEVEHIYSVTAARSEHGQVAIWPVIQIDREGLVRPILEEAGLLSAILEEVINEISHFLFVGVMSWYFSPQGKILYREWGLAATTLWSESACITGVGEQFIRALVNLPLGDTRLIDYDDFYLESELDLTTGPIAVNLAANLAANPAFNPAISDPTRPFLHLFARNPRLKVKYLDSEFLKVKISVSDPNHERALAELAHGERFMLGYDDE